MKTILNRHRLSLLRPYSPLSLAIPIAGSINCLITAVNHPNTGNPSPYYLVLASLLPIIAFGYMQLSNKWPRIMVLGASALVAALCYMTAVATGELPATMYPGYFGLIVLFSIGLPFPDSLWGILLTTIAQVLTSMASTAPVHDILSGSAWFMALVAIVSIHSYGDMRMRNFTVHDSLTGVYRRSILMSSLEDALDHSRKNMEPISLLFIDLDNFKAINDSHGHLGGDEVLRRVGQLIKGSIRGTDFVARWGGDEFVVLMRNLPPHIVSTVAERLRLGVEEHFMDSEGLTVSVGICSITGGCEPNALLSMADSALYIAKNQGRNRVVVSEKTA